MKILHTGEKLTDQLNLRPRQNGYDTSYNKEIDAGVSNEFSTAAYRFGHSMLQVFMMMLLCYNTLIQTIRQRFVNKIVHAGISGISRSPRT